MRKQINGVTVTELSHSDGAKLSVADHGAHVLSWSPAGGKPTLYLSPLSQYGDGKAIRGGVPIIFPQFGERGTGKRHGFARVQNWQQDFAGMERDEMVVRFHLAADKSNTYDWPHEAELKYEIAFAAQHIRLSLTVHNPSSETWTFCAALHTYLHVAQLELLGITGLHHVAYLDQVLSGLQTRQESQVLHVDGEIDRIYKAVHEPIVLTDGARSIVVQKQGFEDVVIWNPGPEKAADLTDMRAQDYRSFVCVEAGAIMQPVTLAAGETWTGTQSIHIGNS